MALELLRGDGRIEAAKKAPPASAGTEDQSHEVAIREVHDYLAGLSDDDFSRLLDEHANGDFAGILRETGALLVRAGTEAREVGRGYPKCTCGCKPVTPPVAGDISDETLPLMPTGHYSIPTVAGDVREGVTGQDVHREWRDGMLFQDRTVSPQRMKWETLSNEDQALDNRIAVRLSALLHPEPPAGTEGPGALERWAGAARKLFAMMIRKPYGTWNECRICGGTWWDNERPRHRFDCPAVAALAEGEKR